MIFDFIVLGAGASGLFFAARHKRGRVLLLDRQDRAGRKLLLSGGGKCNVTNLATGPENYLCSSPGFVSAALKSFRPEDMLAFLQKHSLAVEEREHGQIFLRRGAEALRDLLLKLAEANGAQRLMGGRVSRIRHSGGGSGPPGKGPDGIAVEVADSLPEGARFSVDYAGKSYYGRNLLLATGSAAWPRAGSSASGYGVAAAFGHSVVPVTPALTPLQMPEGWALKGLQGLNPVVRVSLPGPAKAPSFTLPLMFTHGGLSGPACLQISSYLPDSPDGSLQIDFLPGHDLLDLLNRPGGQSVSGLLRRHLPERLVSALLSGPELEPLRRAKCAELGRARRLALKSAIQEFSVIPRKPGLERAEAARGGVGVGDIDPSCMQSRIHRGLYFCGEVMDVAGQLGGYNLHWAWASAASAARAAEGA